MYVDIVISNAFNLNKHFFLFFFLFFLFFLFLLPEFDIHKLRLQLIHWSLKYQGIERPNLLGLSCQPRFECGMTFPTLCLAPGGWMGSRVHAVSRGLLPWVVFSFPWRRCLWGCEAIYKELYFPLGPVLLVLIIIIIIIIIMLFDNILLIIS